MDLDHTNLFYRFGAALVIGILVGLQREYSQDTQDREMFAGVRWSSAHTLKDTLANLAGARVAMLETLEDVDDGTSYRHLAKAGSRIMLPYRSSW